MESGPGADLFLKVGWRAGISRGLIEEMGDSGRCCGLREDRLSGRLD